MMRRAAVLALVGCTHAATTPRAPAAEGITISMYDARSPAASYQVVDDRRFVEITGTELVLEHVSAGASLASLVIEPLDGPPLAIETCAREALPVPPPTAADSQLRAARLRLQVLERERHARLVELGAAKESPPPPPVTQPPPPIDQAVRCTVAGPAGKRLVRLLYVEPGAPYRARHDITVTRPDRAHISSRFIVPTPSWGTRATVILYDGVPGGEHPPIELARGPLVLDGSTSILQIPAREVPASVRRIYRGAVESTGVDSGDPTWHGETRHDVWVYLRLGKVVLAQGARQGSLQVHVELPGELSHDVVPLTAGGDDVELPLYIDRELSGTRTRFDEQLEPDDGAGLTERLLLSVANTGDVPKEVWVEEQLRTAKQRKVERAWPRKPTSSGDVVREKLVVRPHAIERLGFSVGYVFQ